MQSTRPPSVNDGQIFGDPRFQNGSLTPHNPHHHLLAHPADGYRHHDHQAHHIGRFTPPGRLCFVTPELSTTPMACATGCRLNPLSLISPPTVSHGHRSAGVGHRFYGLPQPLVGLANASCALSRSLIDEPLWFRAMFRVSPRWPCPCRPISHY